MMCKIFLGLSFLFSVFSPDFINASPKSRFADGKVKKWLDGKILFFRERCFCKVGVIELFNTKRSVLQSLFLILHLLVDSIVMQIIKELFRYSKR